MRVSEPEVHYAVQFLANSLSTFFQLFQGRHCFQGEDKGQLILSHKVSEILTQQPVWQTVSRTYSHPPEAPTAKLRKLAG